MRKIPLSERLRMPIRMVTPGSAVADIGCDHAHTDIRLLQDGIASHCIACDVRTGPLQKARENLEAYGYEKEVELRLSYGLHEIKAGEVNSVIIAGMGGLLITDILREAQDKLDSFSELILQPQSHAYEVRSFLEEKGFVIADEAMCREGDKFYTCIKAVHAPVEDRAESMLQEAEAVRQKAEGIRQETEAVRQKAESTRQEAEAVSQRGVSGCGLSETELMYGPVLIGQQNPVLKEFLEIEYRKAMFRLNETRKSTDPAAAEKTRYFDKITEMIRSLEWVDIEENGG